MFLSQAELYELTEYRRPMNDRRVDATALVYFDALLEDDDRFDRPWLYEHVDADDWMRLHWRRFIKPAEVIVASRIPVADVGRYRRRTRRPRPPS